MFIVCVRFLKKQRLREYFNPLSTEDEPWETRRVPGRDEEEEREWKVETGNGSILRGVVNKKPSTFFEVISNCNGEWLAT